MGSIKTFKVNGVEHAWLQGQEDRYSATRCGKVYSHIRGVKEVGKFNKHLGRYTTSVYSNGKETRCSRARVVLAAWTGTDLSTDLQCLHNDGNSLNDGLSNLRWGTHSENMIDKGRHGRHRDQKLTYSDMRDIIRMYYVESVRETAIAEKYGVSCRNIYSIRKAYEEDNSRYEETPHEVSELS